MQFPRRSTRYRFLFYGGLLSLVFSGWLASAQSINWRPLGQSVKPAKTRSSSAGVAQQNVVPLTPGTPQTGTVNGAPVANQCTLHTTQFSIALPPEAKRLQFILSGDQDVDLYARFGNPISSDVDYGSESPDPEEDITITANILPPLKIGTYYAAITNCSTSPAKFTLTANVYTGSGQITEVLKADDNSADDAALVDGLIVNRLTPTAYPARVQKLSFQLAAFQGLPNPTGKQLRMVAFTLPTGAPIPATPTFLIDRLVTLPAINANLRFYDFDVSETVVITEGDLYVGFQVTDAATSGIALIIDDTNAQGRTLVSQGGAALQVVPQINAMIRAVVLSGSATNSTASVSAASFSGTALAAESIVAAFGQKLATATASATTTPLPTTLAGTTVKVRDSAGVERLAQLFFVSSGQVNYLIPAGTANGTATVTITSGDGTVSTGTINIASVAPGLFSANASGSGVASAQVFRRNAAGQDSFEPVARFDTATNSFVAVPIDLGPAGDQVFLILYGTGFRNVSGLANVTARIGGQDAEVIFAGATPGFFGLDQANVRIPRALAGRGEVDVVLTVAGQAANVVRVNVR